MLSFCLLFLLLSLLNKGLVTSEQIPIEHEPIFSNTQKLDHDKIHREMRDQLLPQIRQMSQQLQRIILSTTKAFDTMKKTKRVPNISCLPSSLILYINELSINLTRIMKTEVPFIEHELERIHLDMDQLENQINPLAHHHKLNKEQLETLRKLTTDYEKLNDETRELNRKVTQISNETLQPGLDPVDQYNQCLKSTAQALIDYSLDQLIEHMDDDNDDEIIDSNDILLTNNHTDL